VTVLKNDLFLTYRPTPGLYPPDSLFSVRKSAVARVLKGVFLSKTATLGGPVWEFENVV